MIADAARALSRKERSVLYGQALALVIAVLVAGLTTEASDWRPVGLLILLAAGTVTSGMFPIEIRGVKTAGSSIGIVLSMALLGPAPAAAIGVTAMLAQAIRVRPPLQTIISNASTFAIFPLAGGFLVEAAREAGWTQTNWGLALVVAGAFLLANFLNFMLLEIDLKLTRGNSFIRDLRDVYLPVVPVELASGLLTASMAAIYQAIGMGISAMLILVGLIFQYLLHTTFVARQRGEQLERRGHELASLQVGLLSTVIKTLSLRDKTTARHSAAVARFAKHIAEELGMDAEQQDFVHTAGLLHDIGKFVFPDDILFAHTGLTDEQFAIVKSHPQRGAELVASIEGYGPVADVILAHHERIDGRGYPFGIAGEEIPIEARIIAVADTYDVMTSRDSYRRPVSPAEAIKELRRVSGAQLDGEVVEVFISLVQRTNLVFRHTDDEDFERELGVERRVRAHAAPKVAA